MRTEDINKIPSLLTNYLRVDLGAVYQNCANGGKYLFNHDSVNFDETELRYYLGTYWLRSFTESSQILQEIYNNGNAGKMMQSKEEINILIIGSGSGGDMAGILFFLVRNNLTGKKIRILSVDGNIKALEIQNGIFSKFFGQFGIEAEFAATAPVNRNKTGFINELSGIINERNLKFDFVLCFKVINEFYRKDYSNIGLTHELLSLADINLKDYGFVIIADVTDKVFNNSDFMPKVLNREVQEYLKLNRRLVFLIPKCCAYYNSVCTGCDCFRNRSFTLRTINGTSDTEKLCYSVLARPEVSNKILLNDLKKDSYRISKSNWNVGECHKGVHRKLNVSTTANDPYILSS